MSRKNTTTTLPWSQLLIVRMQQALLLSASLCTSFVHAGPEGGVVTGGAGSISQSGLTTTIQQQSQNMAIDWQSYNINSSERVQYLQPNQSSISLNHILSNSASEIRGRIDANGQVILVNPNGIFFTPDSVINVGGIIASALDIKTSDFMNRDYLLNEVIGSNGVVINRGTINAALGGNVALLGKQVENSGLIAANLGSVALAAGKQAVLTFDDAGLIGVRVSEAVLQEELGLDPAVLNSGTIQAHAGQVLLTGSVSQNVFSQAVNSGGIEQARSVVVNGDGSFDLGDGADVVNSGSVDVSSSGDTPLWFDRLTTNGGIDQPRPDTAGRIALLGENVTSSGMLKADADRGDGGEIELHSNNTTRLTSNSVTSAQSSSSGTGGTIKILGERIGLFDNSQLNASGDLGGGALLIGGDQQGQNRWIKNAEYLFVGKNAMLVADGLGHGNGGKLITFATDTARIHGGLYARGGSRSGDGGFIETSGLRGFDISRAPDASATVGKGGMWLIDPTDLTIVDGNGSLSVNIPGQNGPYNFSPSASGARLGVDLIWGALSRGNVTVTTVGSQDRPNELGDITFDANLNYDGVPDNRLLTLNAAGGITFTANSRIYDSDLNDNDRLAVKLLAIGGVEINSTAGVTTGGGVFEVGSTGNRPLYFSAGSGIDTSGSNAGNGRAGGNITIYSQGDVNISAINAAGGARTIGGDGNAGGAVNLTAKNITVGLINTSGSNAHGGNNNASNSGGDAGDITLNANGDTPSITLNGNIQAVGGAKTGNSTNDTPGDNKTARLILTSTTTANVELNYIGNLTSDINITGSAGTDTLKAANRSNLWTITGNKQGTLNSNVTFLNIENLIGGTQADTFTFGNSGVIGILDGGSGNNTLNARNVTTGENIWSIGNANTLDFIVTNPPSSSRYVAGFLNLQTLNGGSGVDTFNVTTDFAGTFNGGAGLDKLIGANALNAWVVNGENSGSLTVTADGTDIDFLSIENLTGGTLDDIFTLEAAGNVTGSIDGGLGSNSSNTLNARVGQDNVWSISGSNSSVTNVTKFLNLQTLNGGAFVDTFTISSSFGGTLHGGDGSDLFNFNATGLTVTQINGGDREGDLDRLTGANGPNTWNVNGFNSGTLTGSSTVTFGGIENLTGGGSSDTFNISSSVSGVLDGGAGNDTFTLNASGLSINTLIGGDGSDTLLGANEAAIWSINGVDSGLLVTTGNREVRFSGVENLTGNQGADTFTIEPNGKVTGTINGGVGNGVNQINGRSDISNSWSITTTTKSLSDASVATPVIYLDNFTNIQVLHGGNFIDTFDLTATFAGEIYGNGGDDVFNIAEPDGGLMKLYGGDGADSFTFVASGASASLIDGGSGVDRLQAFDRGNTWLIGPASNTLNDSTAFTGVESLLGGGDKDTFNISSSFAGTLSGGAGDDEFTLITAGVSVTGIEGGGGSDTLSGADEVNVWTVNRANGGVLDGRVASFTEIENLKGNAKDDRFVFTALASSLSGWLDGADPETGGDSDSVDLTAAGDRSILIREGSPRQGELLGFFNIERFSANASSNSSLTGSDVSNRWQIKSATAGSVGSVAFDGFNRLVGGALQDTFLLHDTIDFTGSIDGAGGSDTLVGGNRPNLWTITEANKGSVTGVTGTFSNIENLTGGANNDSFLFSSATAGVSGLIDGGEQVLAGEDSVDLRAAGSKTITIGQGLLNIERISANGSSILVGGNGPNEWWISGVDAGSVGTLNFSGFNRLVGGGVQDIFRLHETVDFAGSIDGAGGSDTIVGGNRINSWTITVANSGGVTGLTGGYSSIENLTGNADNDSFTFTSASANISGRIDGAGQSTEDSVDLRLAGNRAIVIGQGLFDVERISANGTSTLTGGNGPNEWQLSSVDGGRVGTLTFTGFNQLVGGALEDTFLLHDTIDFTGSIDGAGGGDTLIGGNRFFNNWTITAANSGSVTGLTGGFAGMESLVGGSGQDIFNLHNSLNFAGSVNGAGGINDTVTGGNRDNSWTIDGAGSGGVTGLTGGYSNIENLTGGASNDSFHFSSAADMSGLINGGDQSLSGEDSVNIVALGEQTITLGQRFVNVERITADANSSSTLTGSNAINEWQITGDRAGSVGGVKFTGFNRLVGGALQDTFRLHGTADFGGSIDGAGGSDTIVGGNRANLWTIDGAGSGGVTGLTGGYSSIENLTGNANNDSFRFTTPTASIAAAIDGADPETGGDSDSVDLTAAGDRNILIREGSPLPGERGFFNIERFSANASSNSSLTGSDVSNRWQINSATAGVVGSVAFDGFSRLIGGASQDTFLLHGTVDFGGSIDGAGGSDTIVGGNRFNSWAITAANSGSVTGLTGGFAGMESLAGGSGQDIFNLHSSVDFAGSIDGAGGSDTVVGGNRANLWTITEANKGGVTGVTGTFSNIENLTGSARDDSFTFTTTSANISGLIDGAGQSIEDSVDLRLAGGRAIVIGQGLLDIERITADANSSSTLTGSDVDNSWQINSATAGVVGSVAFDGFNRLVGGAMQDTFRLHGTVDFAGSIDGAGGSDSVVGGNRANSWAITAANSGSVTGLTVGFAGMESLVGGSGQDIFNLHNSLNFAGSIDGLGGSDSVVGGNRVNSWTIRGADSGSVTGLTGGFAGIEWLTGNSGQDSFQLHDTLDFGGGIDGAGGSDSVIAGNRSNLWTLSGADSGGVTGVAAGFTGIEQLTGNGGDDSFRLHNSAEFGGSLDGMDGVNSLSGGDRDSSWNITGADSGTVTGLSGGYRQIQNLTGGSAADRFTLAPAGAVSGLLDGGAGGNTLTARAGSDNLWSLSATGNRVSHVNLFRTIATLNGGGLADTFDISTAFGGTINGLAGDDTFNLTVAVTGVLDGGAGADQFNLNATGLAIASIIGGDGMDTLRGAADAALWSVTGVGSGLLTTPGSVTFSGIENLTGGSGDDRFLFGANGQLSGVIDGGDQRSGDSLDITQLSANKNIQLGSQLNSSRDLTVNRLETITAKAINLYGENRDSRWLITGSASATLNEGAEQLLLSGLKNITGGAANDSVRFADGATFGGTIDGGAGNDTISYSNQVDAIVTVGSALEQIAGSTIIGIEGVVGGINSTLQGADSSSRWVISGNGQGYVDYTVVTNGGGNPGNVRLYFDGFSHLSGGNADDTFLFNGNGALSGLINGGAYTQNGNTVDMSAVSGAVSVTLEQSIRNITRITGNNSNSTLVGSAAANLFTLTGANRGRVEGVLEFVNFNHLNGGAGDDQFTFESSALLAGNLEGGAGSDSVNMAALNSVAAVLGERLRSVETLTGNNRTSTLTGENNINTWTITGENRGVIDGAVTFIGFNHLVGGSASDNFYFKPAGRISGVIDGGGADSGQDSVNMSELTTVEVDLARDLVNIRQITGNASVSGRQSTLLGRDEESLWSLSGANSGSVNGIDFVNFSHLVGGNANDTFLFNAGSSLSGRIDGGEQSSLDTVDMAALATVEIDLANDIVNIEKITGNNSRSTLIGKNSENSWTLSGANSGSLNGLAFTGFNHLVGGDQNDNFSFIRGSSLSGLIDGGGHTSGDTVDMSALATVDVVVGRGVVNIEKITGNNSSSTLTGDNIDSLWRLNGANSGELNGMQFVNFNNLQGGGGDDTYLFNRGSSLSGWINGGAQLRQDSLNMAALERVELTLGNNVLGVEQLVGNNINSTLTGAEGANPWRVTAENSGTINDIRFSGFNHLVGGAGDDAFTFLAGSGLTGILDGGGQLTGDSLDMSALASVDVRLGGNVRNIEALTGNNSNSRLTALEQQNSWRVTGQNSGTLNDITYTHFNHLVGGGLDDSFLFSRSGDITGSIDGGGQINRDSVDMAALARVDLLLGRDIVNIESLTGNNSDSTLTATDSANRWSIESLNGGQLNSQAGVLHFTGFNQLVGGSARDQFILSGSGIVNGNLAGGEGDDTLTVALTGSQSGATRFNGGGGDDSVILTGRSDAERYQADDADGEFSFTSGAATYTLALSNVAAIRDDVVTGLSVYGSAANDTLLLTRGAYILNRAAPVSYSNKQSLTFDGAAGDADTITLQGALRASEEITLISEIIDGSPDATLTANTLTLSGVSRAGEAGNRLQSDLKNLQLIHSGGLYLSNASDLSLTRMSATGAVDLLINGTLASSAALASDHAVTVAATGDIQLGNRDNLLRGPLRLSSPGGDITLNNSSDTTLARLEAENVTVAVTGNLTSRGGVKVSGNSRLTATGNIEITGSNDFASVALFANNITLHDDNSLDITTLTAAEKASITAGSGIKVGSLRAPHLTLDAGAGQILDNNGAALNITADTLVLRAGSGIGIIINGAADPLETEVATLDAISQTGDIGISNKGTLMVTNLVTQGDIALTNERDVIVDTIDAGYERGTLIINVTHGSLYGYSSLPGNPLAQRHYINTPDITANIASITASGDVGAPYKPVSINVQEEFALLSNIGNPYYYGNRRPNLVIDSSKIKVSVFDALVGLSGQQLITVETLADIDPAIFTDVKNFNQGDIAVMLPKDQQYGDSDEDNDDDEDEDDALGG